MKGIILTLENYSVEVKLPESIIELKKNITLAFKPNWDNFSFYFEDDNKKEIQIKDEESFNNFLMKYNEKKTDKIIIKENKNNVYKTEELFNINKIEENKNKNQFSSVENSPSDIHIQSNLSLQSDSSNAKNSLVRDLHQFQKKSGNNNSQNNKSDSYLSIDKKSAIKIKYIQININSNEIQNHINQIDDVQNKKDRENSKIHKYKIKIGELEAKIKELENKNSELLKQNYSYKTTISNLEKYKLELEQSFNKKIEYLKNYELKISKMNKEINIFNKEKKRNTISNPACKIIHKTIHTNIECMNCHQKPIIGYRYNCKEFSNFNLCLKCYVENCDTQKYPYFFCRINTNIVNNINNSQPNKIYMEKNIQQNIPNIYTYKCLSNNIIKIMYKGRNETTIKAIIMNDSKFKWPENIRLICDENNSEIQTEDIQLKPLSANAKTILNIQFKNLQSLNPKIYKASFDFNINGQNFGKKLYVYISVQNETEIEMIKKFRMKYKTPERFTDKTIANFLDIYNGDFEKVYYKLYFC